MVWSACRSSDCRGQATVAMSLDGDLQHSLRIGDTILLYAKEARGYVFSELTRWVCWLIDIIRRPAYNIYGWLQILHRYAFSHTCPVRSTTQWLSLRAREPLSKNLVSAMSTVLAQLVPNPCKFACFSCSCHIRCCNCKQEQSSAGTGGGQEEDWVRPLCVVVSWELLAKPVHCNLTQYVRVDMCPCVEGLYCRKREMTSQQRDILHWTNVSKGQG